MRLPPRRARPRRPFETALRGRGRFRAHLRAPVRGDDRHDDVGPRRRAAPLRPRPPRLPLRLLAGGAALDLRRLRRRGGRPLLRPRPAAGRACRRCRRGDRRRSLGDARRLRELRAHVRALRLRGGSRRRPLRALRPAPDDGHRGRRVGRRLASPRRAPVRRNRGRRRSRGRALPLARAASACRLARRSRGPRHDPVRSRRPAPGRPFRAERASSRAASRPGPRRGTSSRTRSAGSAAAAAGRSSSSWRSRPGGS